MRKPNLRSLSLPLAAWLPGLVLASGLGTATPTRGIDPPTLPGDSLFQLAVPLETSAGQRMQLADLRGHPLLISMFYAQCTSICPMLTSRLQALVNELTPAERDRLTVLMVTFDSARDTPDSLAEFRKVHGIDQANWIVARTSRQNVRLLSAALGIRYRQLPDQSFNHSALICLTDADGVIRARASDVLAQQADFLGAVHALLGAP